ncbi:HNH endonuclease [Halomonas sp. SL1]|uniref:HNH endonuclease n=1 Tax=Halomonas sp. SL1 TaxID=2137478 RepID=UPI000D1782EF|nr:HNH endonuclease [Halomonas sp. SL1]RAH37421.1 HNH endonuclease [Halomonas sp. SL1]
MSDHDRRGSSAQRGYGNRWKKARAGFLRKHPLCAMCQAKGKVVPAVIVDHIKPHRGDMTLFWDRDNWQPLCKWHHDSVKQRMERGDQGCDESGIPLTPGHHWSQ